MAKLRNPLSAVPILGLIDFIAETDKANKNIASVWIMYLLKNHEVISSLHLGRALTILAIQTNIEKQVGQGTYLAHHIRRSL